MSILETLSRNIRIELAKQNCSQRGLADQCGVTFQTLNSIVREKTFPSLRVVEKIADGLGVKVIDLFRDNT